MTAQLVAAALLAWCAPLFAADSAYCAYEVKVLNPSNGPAAKIPVGIAHQRDTLTQTMTDANGIAKICDAPIGAVDVFIGFDVCGLVIIREVKPLWLETKRLLATYTDSACDHFIFPKRCHALLRVKDETGRPVAGAHFESDSGDGRQQILSDSFGRLFRTIEENRTLEGHLTKTGYNTAPVSQKCSLRGSDVDIELVVVLRKR